MDNISFWLYQCQSARAYEVLAAYGYKHSSVLHGDIGGATVRVSGRFWELDEGGNYMIIQPVWYDTPSLANPVDEPLLFDLIAWHPRKPEKWYFYRGERGLILGEKPLFEADVFHNPLQLHRTPFAWLKAGCQGSVLLDKHSLNRLSGLKEVVCEDVNQGVRLKEALYAHHLMGMPHLTVPAGGRS